MYKYILFIYSHILTYHTHITFGPGFHLWFKCATNLYL